MTKSRALHRGAALTAAALGAAGLAYGAYVANAWLRYGQPSLPNGDEADVLLDEFMPEYEVAERHVIQVAAPADITLTAATNADLQRSAIVRGIFRAREMILGAEPDVERRPRGMLDELTSIGWRVLADRPGREIVGGAVTQPWKANVVFRGLSAAEFKEFREPGFVKIAWTMRADPISPTASIFRTETRVMTTDATARRRFRWYWARFSPGIVLIRRLLLKSLKDDAERQMATAAS